MNISVEVTDPGDRSRTEAEVAGAVTTWAQEHLAARWGRIDAAYPHAGGDAVVMIRKGRKLVGNFTVTPVRAPSGSP